MNSGASDYERNYEYGDEIASFKRNIIRHMKHHKYTNSRRSQDVSVEYKTKDEIIKILYERLKESNEALSKIRSIVSSSHRTTNISDKNNKILNPLYSTFEK